MFTEAERQFLLTLLIRYTKTARTTHEAINEFWFDEVSAIARKIDDEGWKLHWRIEETMERCSCGHVGGLHPLGEDDERHACTAKRCECPSFKNHLYQDIKRLIDEAGGIENFEVLLNLTEDAELMKQLQATTPRSDAVSNRTN